MANQTNQMARGLVAILAVVLLVGSSLVFISYQSTLPKEKRWLALLPRSEWGFGQLLIASHSPRPRLNPFRVWFFGVQNGVRPVAPIQDKSDGVATVRLGHDRKGWLSSVTVQGKQR
jgi:hypothetical protein